MLNRYKYKRQQDNAEAQELLDRVRKLHTSQSLCDLVSELISSGAEKCMAGEDKNELYKDLFLVVPHALTKAPWGDIAPSFSELVQG